MISTNFLLLVLSTYLRRKTACIELKRCRIMVSLWSSGSFIVPYKLQSRAAIVLDELQRGMVVCHLYQRLLCE